MRTIWLVVVLAAVLIGAAGLYRGLSRARTAVVDAPRPAPDHGAPSGGGPHSTRTGVPSAPWLGPERYSINTSGSLGTVLDRVKAVTGVRVVDESQGQSAGRQIRLEMDDATAGEIVLEVCRQAGLVPASSWGARAVTLRVGDITVDPRPVADSGLFVVRADQVRISQQRTTTLRQGDAEPRNDVRSDLTIRLSVASKSPDLADVLAGVSRFASAVTDAGEVLEVRDPPGAGPAARHRPMMAVPMLGTETATVSLPAPERPARSIRRLNGRLLTYSQSKLTQLKLAPEAGATATEDDVVGTIEAWKLTGGVLTIALHVSYPLLSTGVSLGLTNRTDAVELATALEDGTVVRPQGHSMHGSSGGNREACDLAATFRLDGGSAPDVDHVEVSVRRRGGAFIETPFTIEGIPLPPEAE